jgi:ABC-type Mn2+/Zn2+ transport system permease subunit
VVTVVTLVAALRAVGLVLALGLFILPAITAYLWCERFGSLLLCAAIYGGVAAVLGCYASYHLNLPGVDRAWSPCWVWGSSFRYW